MAIRILFVLTAGVAVAWIEVGALRSFRLEAMPAVLLITLLAYTLDYIIMAMIGLSAFFVEDTSAFRLIYQKITFVLGGLLIPVDFLPDTLQTVARLLPFNLVLYAPSKLFVAWDGTQFVTVLGLQFVWIGILAGLLTLLYRWGSRQYMYLLCTPTMCNHLSALPALTVRWTFLDESKNCLLEDFALI